MFRGIIYNRARAKQLRDFSGLRFAFNITPTDIDLFLEFGNKAYIVGELKSTNGEVTYGQRLAYERLAVDLTKAGKKVLVIIARHHIDDEEQDIDAANCTAIEYWCDGHWVADGAHTVKSLIYKWMRKIDLDKYLERTS